jgi:hypothetical protein
VAVAAACASVRNAQLEASNRPPEISGDWIDVRHATPEDTSLWVLRADGYDGTAHLLRKSTPSGFVTERQQSRYATWYLHGELADPTSREICFARRIGRDGLTCLRFSLDTIMTGAGARRRLIVKDYQGQHTRADRLLIARDP